MLSVLKVLDLDYALRENKPITPIIETEDLAKKMREYISNLESWERSDFFAKMVIKHSIIDDLREAFPEQEYGIELSAKEFLNSIEERHKDELVNFLMTKLLNSRYNGKGALSIHIRSMTNIATKLKALGKFISDCELVHYIMSSLPENHERHAHQTKYAQVICIFCEEPGHVPKQCSKYKA